MPPQQEAQLETGRHSKRTKKNSNTNKNLQPNLKLPPKKPAILADQLLHALRYNKKRGWRRKELGFAKAKKGDINLRHAISADYHELVSYLEGIKRSSAKAPKGLKIKTLTYAWDVHVDMPRQAYLTTENGSSRYFQRLNNKLATTEEQKQNVIHNFDFAQSVYTPFRLFVQD